MTQATSFAGEYELIAESFDEGFVSSPAIPVAWPNVKFVPPAGEPWVQFGLVPGETRQVSVGGATTDLFRHFGGVEILIHSPLNQGLATILDIVDKVETALCKLRVENITFSSPKVFDLGAQNGYYVYDVVTTYHRDWKRSK
jgi:hypothetical protein